MSYHTYPRFGRLVALLQKLLQCNPVIPVVSFTGHGCLAPCTGAHVGLLLLATCKVESIIVNVQRKDVQHKRPHWFDTVDNGNAVN